MMLERKQRLSERVLFKLGYWAPAALCFGLMLLGASLIIASPLISFSGSAGNWLSTSSLAIDVALWSKSVLGYTLISPELFIRLQKLWLLGHIAGVGLIFYLLGFRLQSAMDSFGPRVVPLSLSKRKRL